MNSPRNILSFSKQKLFVQKDPYEVLRFLYHTDNTNLKKALGSYGVNLNDVEDLKTLARGENEFANMNGFSPYEFIRTYKMDNDRLKSALKFKNIIFQ